jgi:hypothetical protein
VRPRKLTTSVSPAGIDPVELRAFPLMILLGHLLTDPRTERIRLDLSDRFSAVRHRHRGALPMAQAPDSQTERRSSEPKLQQSPSSQSQDRRHQRSKRFLNRCRRPQTMSSSRPGLREVPLRGVTERRKRRGSSRPGEVLSVGLSLVQPSCYSSYLLISFTTYLLLRCIVYRAPSIKSPKRATLKDMTGWNKRLAEIETHREGELLPFLGIMLQGVTHHL